MYHCYVKANSYPVVNLRVNSGRTQETLFNYQKLYWLPQPVGSRQEKWSLRRPHQIVREKQYILVRKRWADINLEFFPGSNMLVHWVVSDALLADVELYAFALSLLAVSSQKDTCHLLTSDSCVQVRNICFLSLRTCVLDLWSSSFP